MRRAPTRHSGRLQLMKAPSQMILTTVALFLLLSTGCGRNENETGPLTTHTPTQAAVQLEQAFAGAAPELKENVDLAARAIRDSEYEKAVVSLQAVREREGVTLEQGLAITAAC